MSQADGSAWAKALRRETLALEKHVSVAGAYAGPVEASEATEKAFHFQPESNREPQGA